MGEENPRQAVCVRTLLAACPFAPGALALDACGGGESGRSAETAQRTTRAIIEKNARDGGYPVTDVKAVQRVRQSSKITCTVWFVHDTTRLKVGGALTCEGGDPRDGCVWRAGANGG